MAAIFQALVALAAFSTLTWSAPAKRADTSGCGYDHHAGYNTNGGAGFSISSSGGTRRYTVRVPDDYDPYAEYPVIFDYHGHGSNRDKQHALSLYDAYVLGRDDYIVVYPQGLIGGDGESAWEGAPYALPGVSDLQFTADLLAHMRGAYCVDSNRVYASGKSNGGGFVGLLACSAQGAEFAAFAASAAALYTDNGSPSSSTYRPCAPSRPDIPILEVHGTADATIPYGGGPKPRGAVVPPITAWLAGWAARDGCAASPALVEYAGYGLRYWNCSGITAMVQGYRVDGLGHCWPTTGTNAESGDLNCSPSPLDFTPIVLNFFELWGLDGFHGVQAV